MMAQTVRTPDSRTCERCGRHERLGTEGYGWRAAETGRVNCIHEWDIDGAFVSVTDDVA
jgi:hypothetical protein